MSADNKIILHRRGFDLGVVCQDKFSNTADAPMPAWSDGKPILLKQHCLPAIQKNISNINRSFGLYQAILNEQECDALFTNSPYRARIAKSFEPLGSVINQGDDQEIETVCFDAIAGEKVVAADLWMKVSWLSFHEEDASMRFRFSFGVDHEEDVAADKNRQLHSARLADAVFPESRLVTQNSRLNDFLRTTLECDSVKYVERIIYFNSAGGGAYLHHDRERGHAGVVYAQLSGSTVWLALSKRSLIKEIVDFVIKSNESTSWPATVDLEMQSHLLKLCGKDHLLSEALESFSDSTLIHLINETEDFIQQLVSNGHCHLLNKGDILLLPQEDDLNCCWHSVFCAGEKTGEALSFAIRRD